MDKYDVKIEWSDDDNAYLATVSGYRYPSLIAHGETYQEALINLQNAVKDYEISAKQMGWKK